MSKPLKSTRFILVVIFLFSLVLRIINLSNIPNGLHTDEVHAGYQGYKIIKTGSDIFGNTLPLYIDKFGDYRPAGIFYIVGTTTSIFGLNDFVVRLPVAVIGSFTIVALYFLVLVLFDNRKIALLSSLLLTVSPWHIVASRSTSESLISLFFVIIGTTLLIHGLKKGKKKFVLFSIPLLLLSYSFYHIPRLFIPIFLALVIFVVKKERKALFLLVLTFIVISIALTFTKFGTGRFNQTSIFVSQDILSRIKVLEDGDQGNILTARIFHNKAVIFSKEFLDQYLSYFSPQYLYIRGGLPDRYVVNDAGLLYYIELPLFLAGLFFIVTKREKFFLLPIIWLLIGPLAAAITVEDSPNTQRSIFLLPAFQIIEAYGLYFLMTNFKADKKRFGTFIVLAFLLNGTYFFHQYFIHSPARTSYARNDGNDRLFSYVYANEEKYDKIYLPVYGDLPVYHYYFKKDQSNFLSITRYEYENGFEAGKYIFVPSECPEDKITKTKQERILIVDYGNCKISTDLIEQMETIYRKDSTLAYVIGELKDITHVK